jgi:hypothetical protein
VGGRLADQAKHRLADPRLEAARPAAGLPSTRRLELVSAKPLRSSAVAMHYRRAR